jgi:hypothetical protein
LNINGQSKEERNLFAGAVGGFCFYLVVAQIATATEARAD